MGLEWTSAAKGEIRAVATTRVLRFKDDVSITVGNDGTVNVRSRIGKGDLGANARRIADFQARLREYLYNRQ